MIEYKKNKLIAIFSKKELFPRIFFSLLVMTC